MEVIKVVIRSSQSQGLSRAVLEVEVSPSYVAVRTQSKGLLQNSSFSNSSRGEVNSFSKTMDKYYLRLLGSVSNSKGIDPSIQRTPSSFVSSYSTVSYTRHTEVSAFVEGSRYSFGKEGSGGSSCIIDRSRILFSSLPCSEEDRGNETSHRLVHPQHLFGCSPLQNGD